MTVSSTPCKTSNSPEPSAKPAVLRPAELPAVDRGGGNRTIPLVSGKVGSRKLLNGITVIGPGTAIQLHTHNCEESVIVIEGRAVAEIDGVDYDLDTFDTTWLPADVQHRFKNASKELPLKIFWTYVSPDANRTIVATGETRSIDAEHNRQK
jgi:quercetin dioxygenase-like cupin family protein